MKEGYQNRVLLQYLPATAILPVFINKLIFLQEKSKRNRSMQKLTFTVEFKLLQDMRHLAAPGPELQGNNPSTTIPKALQVGKVHLYFEPGYAITCGGNLCMYV
jgi:hypothetical protein